MLLRRSRPLHVPLAFPAVRSAAIAFVRGTALGWGRRELASWLLCHYSPCLASDATLGPEGTPAAVKAGLSAVSTELEDERVEQIILDARSSVLRLLSDLAWPSQASVIAQNAIGAGSVIELHDEHSDRSWAPVGRKRMRLADRVASLFIADALNAPSDYRKVSMCRECGDLGFSAPIEHVAWCERTLRVA